MPPWLTWFLKLFQRWFIFYAIINHKYLGFTSNFTFFKIAAEVAAPLCSANKISMISTGDGEIGASKLTGEVSIFSPYLWIPDKNLKHFYISVRLLLGLVFTCDRYVLYLQTFPKELKIKKKLEYRN